MNCRTVLLYARRLADHCRQRQGILVVALIVGTVINLYGQVLVPAMRGVDRPLADFVATFERHPGVTLLSLLLAYLFPLAVGVYSSARARRPAESALALADFTNRKPDSVFRVGRDGRILSVGTGSRRILAEHCVEHAGQLVGKPLWDRIVAGSEPTCGIHILSPLDGRAYTVSHAAGPDGCVDLYLAPLHPRAVNRHV